MKGAFGIAAALALLGGGDAQESASPAPVFERDIRPLLRTWCLRCHGETKDPKGKLDLRLVRSMLAGGKHGAALVPGDRAKSPLYGRVASGEMPEGDEKPSKAEIELLGRWIDAGAPLARPEPDSPDAAEAVSPEDREFWSNRPVRSPPLPQAAGFRHPVDRLLEPARASRGVVARGSADPATLLRRVTFDLTGLPPSPDELKAFLADRAPDAYEKAVDRLLASPRFGERWGRHWMDVWRYCDETLEMEDGKPYHVSGLAHHWRWRDWIVNSVNADKPYDRMVLEMLAGDEIAPEDPEILSATAFLARNRDDLGGRDLVLQSMVEHTGSAFLGVTFKCARCHNHKYDPVSQVEYFQLRAFFEPVELRIDRIVGEPDPYKAGIPRVYDAALEAKTYVQEAGDPKRPDKSRSIVPGLPRVFHPGAVDIKPVPLPPAAWAPGTREDLRMDLLRPPRERLAADVARLSTLLSPPADARDLSLGVLELTASLFDLLALEAVFAAEDVKTGSAKGDVDAFSKTAARAQCLARLARAEAAVARARLPAADEKARKKQKDALAKAEKDLKAAQDEAKKADGAYKAPIPSYPRTSTGRRSLLASWIGSRDNPRTARVAVNHVWMRHFGRPLVPSVFDFGRNGKPPSHPDLHDWLAAELMDSGWSLKKLHRIIVTSEAYRMGSAKRPGHPSEAADPDNTLYHRMNPRRMEAEGVRDSLLFLSGELDLAMGGPPIDVDQADSVLRRSLYIRHPAPDHLRSPFLATFDAPNPAECYRREVTVVPQQALALANSPFAAARTAAIAKRLDGAADDGAFATSAFELILSRPPSDGERDDCLAFLARQRGRHGGAGSPARASLVHVLINHTAFVTVR